MSKPTIALVTAEAARDLDEDLPPLESALRNAGADVTIAEWDRPHEWRRFDLALLRSTWDYPQRLPEFFDWAAQVSTQTKLLNPLSVVKWSSDKHYLRDLVRANVPTVLTKIIEPGESAPWRIAELLSEPNVYEFVVKPAIGAGSRDAQRFGPEEKEAAAEHAQRMLAEKRSVLLQPYLSRVDEHGETALIYSQPNTPKLRHIAANPRVSLSLDGNGRGGDIVILTGTARVDDSAPSSASLPAYQAKYATGIRQLGMTAESFAQAYSVPIRFTPEKLRGH